MSGKWWLLGLTLFMSLFGNPFTELLDSHPVVFFLSLLFWAVYARACTSTANANCSCGSGFLCSDHVCSKCEKEKKCRKGEELKRTGKTFIYFPSSLLVTIYKCSKMINSHVHTTANLKYVFQWKVPGNTLGNVSHVLITHTRTLNRVIANH